MVKRLLLGVGLLVLPLFYGFSEVDLDASLTGLVIATKDVDEDLTSSGLAKGSLTVKSKGSKYVKSQLTLDFTSMRNMGTLSISKAWVKFRYPLIRATLGKNRITWGEGTAFNAGDVIFDDYISPDSEEAEAMDLTADELKSMNRTMVLVTHPMGRFTFAEGIYLPYDFFTMAELAGAAGGVIPSDKEINQHSYGGRFVTKAAGMKFETGYIYNGDLGMHKPYISINGTLLVDYHLSASVNIDHNDSSFDSWKESLKISTGNFYIFDLDDDKTLTLRLEALVKPFGDWESDALMLYPEISFVPNEEIALFFRAIGSPLDLSMKATLGLNWKTYQGFSIGSFISANMGEEGDIYSFSDDNALTFTVAVTHKF